MKNKLLFALLLFFPWLVLAQKSVTLSAKQPMEFGFSVIKTDTTIVKGKSIILGADLVIFGGSGAYLYNWSPKETLNDPTSIHPLASPITNTKYTLTVTDKFGCSFSVNYTVNLKDPPTGVNEELPNQNLHAILFPNPNDGNFKVKLTGKPFDSIDILLLNNDGKLIKKATILNFTGEHTQAFRLNLASGVYLLKINSGIETLSRQFIIN